MAKLGLPKHRYTVAILSWLYVICAILTSLYLIIGTFFGSILVTTVINFAIGCLGIYALKKEDGCLMKCYGVIMVIAVIVQIIAILLLFFLLFARDIFISGFIKGLMDSYYDSVDSRDLLDGTQQLFHCCGQQSYNDWAVQPYSCCQTSNMSNGASNCTVYYPDGCVDKLSAISLYILIVYGLLSLGNIFLHTYAFISSFSLAKHFRLGAIQPRL